MELGAPIPDSPIQHPADPKVLLLPLISQNLVPLSLLINYMYLYAYTYSELRPSFETSLLFRSL